MANSFPTVPHGSIGFSPHRLNARSVTLCRSLARGISVTVAALGLVVLVGWALGVDWLKGVGSGWATVKPNTACALILATVALWPLTTTDRPANPRWRRLGQIAAGAMLLIGAFTLGQQVLAVDLGIDGLLATAGPSRMSPLAATNFFLLGIALFRPTDTTRLAEVWTAQFCALLAAFGALLALTGYLLGQEGLHQMPFFTSTGLPTAVALLALSLAVLCARPEAGMMTLFNADSAGGLVLRRLLGPIALLSVMIDWLELEGERRGVFPAGFNWMLDSTLTTFLAGFLVWLVARLLHEKDLARERAEETLRTSEERFRATFEQAAMGMTVASIDGRFLRVNGRFCTITGYSADEIMTRTFQDITHSDDLESDQRQVQRLLSREIQTYTLEKRYVRKDSSSVWVALTATLVRREDGSPDYFLALIEDITQRRMLETQLRQTQKMEAVGQLAGGVAHDFNNILTAIQGHAGLLDLEATLSAPARSSLDEIRKAAQHAASLTRQLLLFGRREVMQPSRLNLNETVTQLTKMLQRLIGEEVRMTLHLHPQSLPIHADSGMIDQVLMNLAVNARDAMPGGGSLIIETSAQALDATMASQAEVEPGRYACLSVSDTGSGIVPEVLPRIFEPFFTTKETGKGTGLGLATVFGIVKQHRGWLKVYSEMGRGTTFRVFLPLTALPAPLESPAGAPQPLRGQGETVLLVEDDEAVREMTAAMLERYGYKVVAAGNGPDALRLWAGSGENIALLLTDLVMPGGMSGTELAAQLQTRRPDLKIIFTSGYSAEIAGRAINLQPGQRFLQKPFEAQLLLGFIHELLNPT